MILRNLLIRLGGHDPLAICDENREATQPIAMMGATVLMAASVTAINWAIAGHSLAGGDVSVRALSASVVGAGLGFLLVATLDRAGIYQMDTQASRRLRKAALLLVRATMVLLVSAVTTGAIAPRLLEPELKAHALKMREQSELNRLHALRERFSLGSLESSLKQSDADVAGARTAATAVPSDIRAHQERAQACWRDYAARKVRLLQQGYSQTTVQSVQQRLQQDGFYRNGAVDGILGPQTATAVQHFQQTKGLLPTGQLDQQTLAAIGVNGQHDQVETEARRQLASLAEHCNADTAGARRDLDTYGERARNTLAEAERRQADAGLALNEAGTAITDRLFQGSTIEKEAITPQSSTVLESLLASDRGAWTKWYGVYTLITCLELLPLTLKLLSERSVPGVRIAVDRDIAVAAHERRREVVYEDRQREIILRASMDLAMNTALESPAVREQAVRLFQSKIDALIPIEIAKRLFVEIEAGARDAQAAMRRHPDYASVISEAWSRAMAEVVERLRGNRNAPDSTTA